jgi:hypothetical protein
MKIDPIKNGVADAQLATLPSEARHLTPILEAVRDKGLVFGLIQHGSQPNRVLNNVPILAVIGDDLDTSTGPSGFRPDTLKWALTNARSIILHTTTAQEGQYAAAIADALENEWLVVLIESNLTKQQAWIDAIEKHAPQTPLTLISFTPPEACSLRRLVTCPEHRPNRSRSR